MMLPSCISQRGDVCKTDKKQLFAWITNTRALDASLVMCTSIKYYINLPSINSHATKLPPVGSPERTRGLDCADSMVDGASYYQIRQAIPYVATRYMDSNCTVNVNYCSMFSIQYIGSNELVSLAMMGRMTYQRELNIL